MNKNEEFEKWYVGFLNQKGRVPTFIEAYQAGLEAAPTPPAQEAEPVELHYSVIQATAINCGFKLRDQPDGSFDLNPYVYDFAREIQNLCPAPSDKLRQAAEEFVAVYKPGWDHHGAVEYRRLCNALEGKS